MKTWIPVLLCGAWLLPAPAAAGRRKELTWDAFAALVDARHAIRMVLPDGTRIVGNHARFRPEAMDLHVRKTSDRRAHPKGVITIPRRDVKVVEIRGRHWKGRAMGAIVPWEPAPASWPGPWRGPAKRPSMNCCWAED